MKKFNKFIIALGVAFISVSVVFAGSDSACTTPVSSDPCCDSMAMAVAIKAIDANDVTIVYKMVSNEGEQEAKDAFEFTMKVRAANPELKTLSEQYFARTVARLHAGTISQWQRFWLSYFF
jgi:hypothetical protein